MHVASRVAVGVALTFAALGADCNTTPEPSPAPGSWLVLLCKASDAPVEPQQIPYYEAVFSRDSVDLIWQYFNTMSNGAVDVSGSRARGWFTMNVNTATVAARTINTNPSRVQTAQDCRSAAAVGLANMGVGVDMDKYLGVISVINVGVDVGRAGGKNIVVSSHFQGELSLVEHEMLHIYGLRHSNAMAPDAASDHIYSGTTDTEYQDCWDMMSYATCAFAIYGGSHGAQGPGIQAAYLEKLGWIPTGRVFAPGSTGANATIMLAPVSERNKSGNLLARLEVPAGNYVVEYRVPTGYDAQFPGRSVLIREERGVNKQTYLVTKANNDPEWRLGDVFTDSRNWVRIEVTALTPDYANISINTAWAPGVTPGVNGAICGHKSTGQTAPCAVGLRCGARRVGQQLVTVDYYCQP